MIDSGRGAARAGDAQATPTQSHISLSILVYEDETRVFPVGAGCRRNVGADRTENGLPPPASEHVLGTFTLKTRPETSCECLMCATFARQRSRELVNSREPSCVGERLVSSVTTRHPQYPSEARERERARERATERDGVRET